MRRKQHLVNLPPHRIVLAGVFLRRLVFQHRQNFVDKFKRLNSKSEYRNPRIKRSGQAETNPNIK